MSSLLEFLKEHFHWSVADRLEQEFSDLKVRLAAIEAKVGLGPTTQPEKEPPHEGT